jgi:hypothetical protein
VPYGYVKDPEDKTRWLVDDEAATVVQQIFSLCMEGRGPTQIAKALREEKISTPTAYKNRLGRKSPNKEPADPYHWDKNTVISILERREYTGCTVNFKTYTNSIWDKKKRDNAPENQAIFYNTHPAIVDEDVFEKVQEIRQQRHRITKPERAICSPAWSTVPTATPKCATAPPVTLKSGKTTLSAPTIAATPETVPHILFVLWCWKIWSGCT